MNNDTINENQNVNADSVKDVKDEAQNAKSEALSDVHAEERQKAEMAETKPADSAKTEKQVKPAKSTNAGQKSAVGAKRFNGMSKLFKLIYFPVLAVFVLLMLVFSFVDGVNGYAPKAKDYEFYSSVNTHIKAIATSRSSLGSGSVANARNYIESTLASNGFTRVDEQKEGEEDDDDVPVTTVTDWARFSGAATPTVTTMTADLSAEIQTEMGLDGYIVGTELNNVIAAIPSYKTRQGEQSKAVIITARYDSRTDTDGAVANAAFVATLMQTLIQNVAVSNYENDIIVVFTEDMDESYGSYAFFNSFVGLDNVVERATAGLNLDAAGTGGTLALVDYSGAGLNYINSYSKACGTTFNSSVVGAAINPALINNNAVDAFGDIPALQVAVVGNLYAAQSMLDVADNVSSSILKQQAALVGEYIDAFGYTNAEYSAGGKDFAVFSYFDNTVAYNNVASYVIGAFILAAIAAIIILLAIKKKFDLVKMFTALGAQAVVLVGTLSALYAAYFLVTLMLTGFGVLPIHAITQITAFNAGILIAAILVSVAASFGFTTLFKRLFKLKAPDMVRGTVMLIAIVGAIISFAAPEFSYLVSILGLLLAITLLISAVFKDKFQNYFGFSMNKLFLYAIPVALCMPIMMSSLSMLLQLLPLYMLPIVMLMFTAISGVGVPFLDYTRKPLDRIAKKLPPRTVRVERIVTEKVEDRAKKGKFTEKTFKRVEKEKVAINYKNYFGVSVIAVLGCIVALFSGAFGVDYGKTLTKPHAYAESIYNDAIVYEWQKDALGTVTQNIIVDDLIAYKYFRYAVTDLAWDGAKERYYKSVHYNVTDIIANTPDISKEGSIYTVSTYDGPRTAVTLTIPSASAITQVTITNSRDISYVYNFVNVSEITLRLPYGFGNFTMKFQGANPTTINYEERREVSATGSDNALANVDEWNMVLQYYRGTSIANDIRGGIVLKTVETFS